MRNREKRITAMNGAMRGTLSGVIHNPLLGGYYVAGFSMGGGQPLNFGLAHLDAFALVGGFSPAPKTKAPEVLVSHPEEAVRKVKLLWLSCGNRDGLLRISERIHAYLQQKIIPHIWYYEPGKHDFVVWKNDLFLFTQFLFRKE